MEQWDDLAPETQAVHAGVGRYEQRPLVPPIFQTSTFGFDSVEQGAELSAGARKGFIYSRMRNPTVAAMVEAVATLEGGAGALACGSGMAAIHTTLSTFLSSGDHVVCSEAVYGPTCTLIDSMP